MKILLVNPVIRENRPPYDFPLGLGIIAAILRKEGYDVSVYDQNAYRVSIDSMFRSLEKIKGIDIVATGGLITTYRQLKKIVPGLKEIFPKATMVIGGGVTVEPEVLFQNMPVDFCVHGEGEHTFPELCRVLEQNNEDFSSINGISYVEKDNLITTDARPIEQNLDVFPMPAYDLFPSEIYFKNNMIKNFFGIDAGTRRTATLMWSRGCPYRCTFCWRMMGQGIRFRSPQLLFDEISYLRSHYDIDSYLFVDECINGNREKAKEFSLGLVTSGHTAPWYSHARVNSFDDEIAILFRNAGCVGLNFGIESASKDMLKAMNKKTTPQHAANAVEIARNAGIVPVCTFIIGMPGETKRTVEETVHWIVKHKVQKTAFFFATPYPGCDLYHMPDVQNRILESFETKDNFFSALGDASDFCINLTDFSDSQLLGIRKRAELQVALFSPQRWINLVQNPHRWRKVLKRIFQRASY